MTTVTLSVASREDVITGLAAFEGAAQGAHIPSLPSNSSGRR